MLRQIIVSIVAVLILVMAIMWAFKIGKPKELPKKADMQSPARSVQTFLAENKEIQTKIGVYGRLLSFEKTELYAEVGGLVKTLGKPFKEGTTFSKGDLMIAIDDTELQLSIRAQKAALLSSITQIMPDLKIDFPESVQTWDNYRKNYDLEKSINELPTSKSDRERDFIALKNITNQYYNIKAQEEKLLKYKIYAPYNGELTEAMISTGSVIRAGQKIGTLMNSGQYELQTAVAVSDLKFVKVGDIVKLECTDVEGSWTGRIARISGTIDTKTQTVKVFVQLSGPNLRENMFMTGEINANIVANVIEVPRKLLLDDAKLYSVVGDSMLSLIPVQIAKISEQTVMLRAVPESTVLLNESFTTAYEGMKVKISKK
jgi:membrane fusion protein (multidrug efflux system)